MTISFKFEQTPNPNAIKITLSQAIFEGSQSYSFKKGDESDHTLVNDLLAIEGVDNVFGYQDFITVNKTFDADWDAMMPKIEEALGKIT